MKSIFISVIVRTRRILWAFIVAYMVGLHNFYKGEEKALDDIVKSIHTIEHNEVQEDGTPED